MKNKLIYDEIMMKEGTQRYITKMVEWFCSEEMKELVNVFHGKFSNGMHGKWRKDIKGS